jgi:hypothetical protein
LIFDDYFTFFDQNDLQWSQVKRYSLCSNSFQNAVYENSVLMI